MFASPFVNSVSYSPVFLVFIQKPLHVQWALFIQRQIFFFWFFRMSMCSNVSFAQIFRENLLWIVYCRIDWHPMKNDMRFSLIECGEKLKILKMDHQLHITLGPENVRALFRHSFSIYDIVIWSFEQIQKQYIILNNWRERTHFRCQLSGSYSLLMLKYLTNVLRLISLLANNPNIRAFIIRL